MRHSQSPTDATVSVIERQLATLRDARNQMSYARDVSQQLVDDLAGELTSHSNDIATVTCTGTGKVARVTLDSNAYYSAGDAQICAAILESRRIARHEALRDSASLAEAEANQAKRYP
ncbi:MAG TPA: hypothetical protein H9902_03060 [Candidatus Stackebrandtia faecavium]|nr:hypothetical protein [Candidatus Stackebrandtia faecavium]